MVFRRDEAKMRHTVGSIARRVGCSPHLVRRLADKGYVDANRDINNWRVFPKPEKAIHILRQLVHGQVETQTALDISDQTRPSRAVL